MSGTRPSPITIEQPEPGGVNWTMRMPVADARVVVDGEPEGVRIEGLRAVHVRDGHHDHLECPLHAVRLLVRRPTPI